MFLRLLMSFLIAGSLHATVVEEGYFVFDSTGDSLKILNQHKEISIDHRTEEGFEAYGPQGLGTYLKMIDIDHIILDEMLDDQKNLNGYPTPEEIEKQLKDLVKGHEEFVKLYSIGESHEGRKLWTLKFSDNVELNEIEPEVKFIANMHGNEIVGREMMVRLVAELIERYTRGDLIVTDLINNSEVFIIPSMNPDGAAAKRRGNSRWTDLNRDFPDFTTTDNTNNTTGREPETKAVMLFQAQHKFALSANFHGGSVVVNYPWDTHADDAPLTDLILDLSKEYASFNEPMRTSSRFQDGVVNGYRWYHVDGGMQDWSYYWYNDLQVTIELSDHKWPDYSEIPQFYEENRASLVQYLNRVHQGAGFYFPNNPGTKGKVEITKLKFFPLEKEMALGSYPFSTGEFYKVLPVGRYQFKITTSDGKVKTINTNVGFNTGINNGNYLPL